MIKFLRKLFRKKAKSDYGDWLDKQSEWMKESFALIKELSPNRAQDLAARMYIQLLTNHPDNPMRVTKMILEELKEMQTEVA